MFFTKWLRMERIYRFFSVYLIYFLVHSSYIAETAVFLRPYHPIL